MVITLSPRLSASLRICSVVILNFVRICGNCVTRTPMKPVSFITSKMSVNEKGGNEFQRLEPRAHFTFLLAGSLSAARPRVAASSASAERRGHVVRHLVVEFISDEAGRAVHEPGQLLGKLSPARRSFLCGLCVFAWNKNTASGRTFPTRPSEPNRLPQPLQ